MEVYEAGEKEDTVECDVKLKESPVFGVKEDRKGSVVRRKGEHYLGIVDQNKIKPANAKK